MKPCSVRMIQQIANFTKPLSASRRFAFSRQSIFNLRMASNSKTLGAGFVLTKDYIRNAYKHLEETDDIEHRNQFFKKYMVENVIWEITGNGHEMAGTRHSLAEHSAVSFTRLGKKLTGPIKFVVRSIILEPDTGLACVEIRGHATRTNGECRVSMCQPSSGHSASQVPINSTDGRKNRTTVQQRLCMGNAVERGGENLFRSELPRYQPCRESPARRVR